MPRLPMGLRSLRSSPLEVGLGPTDRVGRLMLKWISDFFSSLLLELGAVAGPYFTDLRIYPPPSPSHAATLRPGHAHLRIKTAAGDRERTRAAG
jgi:hypothetical protein